jgi:hypothetical protein
MNQQKIENRFVDVAGSPRDMGFQQGEKFRELIQGTFKRLLRFEGIKLVKPKLLPAFIFGGLLKKKIVKEWKKPLEIIAPALKERIAGIAEGAGTPLDELLVIQALEVLSDEINLVTTGGCSSFAVLPEKYEGNELVIGKNFDFMNDFMDDNLIRISRPAGKFRSVELTYQQISGSHAGMNERGLVVVYNYGITAEHTRVRLPITFMVQQVLENCASVDDALTVVQSFRYPNAAILIIADSKNKVVSVEISPEHIDYRYPAGGFLVNTNFYLCRETKKCDIPQDLRYSKRAPKGLAGKRIHETNEKRYGCAMELMNREKGRLTLGSLLNVLRSHNGSPAGDDNTICRHGEFFCTQASSLFFPKHKKVMVVLGAPCRNEYREYYL